MASNRPILDTFDLKKYDLSLDSVFKEYPRECLPKTLTKSRQAKAKDLDFEYIDANVYDQQANHVATKIPARKIPYYIRGLSILYFEFYGKTTDYKVRWYDDIEYWAQKAGGKKAICIDFSKADIPHSTK